MLSPIGEVNGVLIQCLAGVFGIRVIDLAAAAHLLYHAPQGVRLDLQFLQQVANTAFILNGGQQNHFAGNEVIARLLSILIGQVERAREIW